MNFATYLGLKDPYRDGLQPDPERDADLYVDLDDLIPKCMARLAARAPKIVLMGDYGTGKTHLLHVLQTQLDRDRFEPIYVKLEAYGRIAESRHLHDNLLTALEAGDRLQTALQGVDPAPTKDLQRAIDLLRESPTHPEARAWLFGRGPTPARAMRAGFSSPLSLHARGVTYALMWRYLADGFRKATERELILLIDESETFQHQVDQSRAADLGAAIREVFDAANKSFGVVMGLTAPRLRVSDFSLHPLGRPDVASRITGIMLKLQALETPDRRRRFISELLRRLMQDPASFLAPDAVEALVTYGPTWARDANLLQREPVQREYVKLLDRIALRAWDEKRPLPLRVEHLGADGPMP